MSEPVELDLYFLAGPGTAGGDIDGPVAIERTLVKDHIPVLNTGDFIMRIYSEVLKTGGKIRQLTISGHGTRGAFRIGDDLIVAASENFDRLGVLRSYFAPDAVVYISACRCGEINFTFQQLSKLWGGVKVVAYTGPVYVSQENGIRPTGKTIICKLSQCKAAETVNLPWTLSWIDQNYLTHWQYDTGEAIP